MEWHSFRLIQAGSCATDRDAQSGALKEIAARVALGIAPPTMAVLVAHREVAGGYPDLVVAIPLEAEDAADWLRGDRTLARELAEEMEETAAVFLNQVKRGRVN